MRHAGSENLVFAAVMFVIGLLLVMAAACGRRAAQRALMTRRRRRYELSMLEEADARRLGER